jgi:tryptophanyl-tRNA synthetase
MNRAHAYKGAVDVNVNAEQDADLGITMGLFCYPVLMSADILAFNANKVPVGRDQIQHIEMARDIAGRLNHLYGQQLVLPEAVVDDSETALLKGLDGRKMSKSYNNTIPLFESEKKLKKAINKIKTNLLEPGEAKDPNDSTVFDIYRAFATAEQTAEMHQKFLDGIAWGEAKKELFALVNEELGEAREKYNALMAAPNDVEDILQAGAAKARSRAQSIVTPLRESMGLVKFS